MADQAAEKEGWKPWEGAYRVPDLDLEICPWCLQARTSFFVVVYDIAGTLVCEPVCETCSPAADEYIRMRKTGLSRRMTLDDFGWRERGGRKPRKKAPTARTSATGEHKPAEDGRSLVKDLDSPGELTPATVVGGSGTEVSGSADQGSRE